MENVLVCPALILSTSGITDTFLKLFEKEPINQVIGYGSFSDVDNKCKPRQEKNVVDYISDIKDMFSGDSFSMRRLFISYEGGQLTVDPLDPLFVSAERMFPDLFRIMKKRRGTAFTPAEINTMITCLDSPGRHIVFKGHLNMWLKSGRAKEVTVFIGPSEPIKDLVELRWDLLAVKPGVKNLLVPCLEFVPKGVSDYKVTVVKVDRDWALRVIPSKYHSLYFAFQHLNSRIKASSVSLFISETMIQIPESSNSTSALPESPLVSENGIRVIICPPSVAKSCGLPLLSELSETPVSGTSVFSLSSHKTFNFPQMWGVRLLFMSKTMRDKLDKAERKSFLSFSSKMHRKGTPFSDLPIREQESTVAPLSSQTLPEEVTLYLVFDLSVTLSNLLIVELPCVSVIALPRAHEFHESFNSKLVRFKSDWDEVSAAIYRVQIWMMRNGDYFHIPKVKEPSGIIGIPESGFLDVKISDTYAIASPYIRRAIQGIEDRHKSLRGWGVFGPKGCGKSSLMSLLSTKIACIDSDEPAVDFKLYDKWPCGAQDQSTRDQENILFSGYKDFFKDWVSPKLKDPKYHDGFVLFTHSNIELSHITFQGIRIKLLPTVDCQQSVIRRGRGLPQELRAYQYFNEFTKTYNYPKQTLTLAELYEVVMVMIKTEPPVLAPPVDPPLSDFHE